MALTKTCSKCGGGIADAKYDDDGNPIWDCRNCYKKYPRKVRNTKKKQERDTKSKKTRALFNKLLKNI